MPEPLDEYRRKRDFQKTPEPAPGEGRRVAARHAFVVHRHEARRLHYDLRLETEGVLASFAVPKGFSYDPADKRLAVRTEDHPLEYETFSGTIPKGEYGAGTMTIWDRGTYETIDGRDLREWLDRGELKLILRGRKLRGEWHVVKTAADPRSWLLFKSKDRYAGPPRDTALGVDLARAPEARLPGRVRRMETGDTSAVFSAIDWLFEMRFDGKRVFAVKEGDVTRLRGVRADLPEVLADLGGLRAENALLDGVLVALDEHRRPSREHLDRRLAGKSDDPVFLYVVDLLYHDAYDLRPLPLQDRKAALRATVPKLGAVLYVDHVAGSGEELADAVAAAGLPGMIAKRADSPYVAGPSPDWRDVPVAAARPRPAAAPRRAGGGRRSRVRLTNLEKVYWPAAGYTKGDLVRYYEQVADVLLPYLHERPVHMLRYPDGIEGKSFYQRQANAQLPDWIERVPVEGTTSGEVVPHMIVNDRDALLYLVNLGSIDLHPWLSRRGSLDAPDFTVLDLDAKESPFTDVIRIAREAGKLLRGIGLRPCLKTSGATGMHVYVPLQPGYTYDHSRMFCEGVARVLARELREIATVERIPGHRGGRVYLDFLQNRRSQTVVPPYVARPVPKACVSTPLHWDELDSSLHPSLFTIQTMPARLERLGDLFRPTLADPQDLLPAIAKLEEQLTGR